MTPSPCKGEGWGGGGSSDPRSRLFKPRRPSAAIRSKHSGLALARGRGQPLSRITSMTIFPFFCSVSA